jgi:5-methylcytosine-specific restriction endonuclease McrA
MDKKRNFQLRKKCFERDNFTCQKCKFEDKTGGKLEAHHVFPLFAGGKDEIENLITLCFDCHHFAPNTREDFENYLGEEIDGTSTTLIRAFNKVQQEHPEFYP